MATIASLGDIDKIAIEKMKESGDYRQDCWHLYHLTVALVIFQGTPMKVAILGQSTAIPPRGISRNEGIATVKECTN